MRISAGYSVFKFVVGNCYEALTWDRLNLLATYILHLLQVKTSVSYSERETAQIARGTDIIR